MLAGAPDAIELAERIVDIDSDTVAALLRTAPAVALQNAAKQRFGESFGPMRNLKGRSANASGRKEPRLKRYLRPAIDSRIICDGHTGSSTRSCTGSAEDAAPAEIEPKFNDKLRFSSRITTRMGQSVSTPEPRLFSSVKAIDIFRGIIVAVAALSGWSCAAQPPKCTCQASTDAQPAPLPAGTSQSTLQPVPGNTMTTGYFYAVDGATTSWRTCGTDDVVTVRTSQVVSAVRNGTCAGVAFGFNTKYTITVRP